ncbi:hypothetical protein [Actinomadura parmotrematis]|uniref:Uncharacterized protein n=1 Tax=Actinomadura parmotrematis TaxID=2864039 RepID=A0ABS7FTI5_9ACTN|nr:hypothetical protein [Actinomadura parmotrematis]MBW8483054.1 hypothetical protein [Actinomadura parmotrematis]
MDDVPLTDRWMVPADGGPPLVPVRAALDMARGAYEEAMRTYGLIPGTITAITALAGQALDALDEDGS